jgi:glycosyltransferase involved in cell wall biosynthesis
MNSTHTDPRPGGVDDTVLSVIAPCLNEEGNVDSLADRTLAVFDEMGVAAELLLIDDGSADTTWERIQRRSQGDGRVRGVRHTFNRGIAEAWRTGLTSASGELICLIDADLQNRPEDIPRLYMAYLRELPDMVQAVRHPVSGARHRHLFSRGLNLLLNLTFRTHLRDGKSGFVLCRRGTLAGILKHRYSYRYFQSFIGAAAGLQGCAIAEVDTDFELRRAGTSFLSRFPIGVSMWICWELLKYRVETRASAARASALRRGWSLPPVTVEAAGGKL